MSRLIRLFTFCSPTLDGNDCPHNIYSNQSSLTANVQPGHSVSPVMGNRTVINGDISHVRPRLPGGFPVNRDSAMTLTPSDGYYSGGGLQSTQKGKYGNRDMKTELQDITVEMDRITLGELLEEGKLTLQGAVGISTMYIFYTIIKEAFKKSNFHYHGKTRH